MLLSNLQKYDSLNIDSPMASVDFSIMLSKYIDLYYKPPFKDFVILCIGTDRSTGDSLGPIIGHKLIHSIEKYPGFHVYGTLDHPVHAKNLQEKIDYIYRTLDSPFVLAIDACLGKIDRIGFISVGNGPLKPGAGVNKTLPPVGDINITGIVNLSGYMEYMVLQNTRLSLVMKMADTLVNSIKYSLWKLNQQKLLLEN